MDFDGTELSSSKIPEKTLLFHYPNHPTKLILLLCPHTIEMEKILIIGALGQVGQELVEKLTESHGEDNVIASDIREGDFGNVTFEQLDVMDKSRLEDIISRHKITWVFHLAALLSANAEKNPELGWKLNMDGLFHVLDLAKAGKIKRIFWPSSIAVFGPSTPKEMTPQDTTADPDTVYGISKLAGERWCAYYAKNYGVDVRSIRYPGLIGHKSLPGGGTTDYAVDIFHQARKTNSYTCFLEAKTSLPMMHMDDAIRATLDIMNANPEDIKIRSSYNIAGVSFDPEELSNEIKKHIPDFQISYEPDFRQQIAATWPASIDDARANEDWGWKATYDLESLVKNMLENIR